MNKPWFIRRGGPVLFHLGPHAWQGWAITAVFVAATALTVSVLRRYLMGHLSVASSAIVTIGLVAILLGCFTAVALRFSVSETSRKNGGRRD